MIDESSAASVAAAASLQLRLLWFVSLRSRPFLPARHCASADASYGPVSVCLSQVGVLSKGKDGLFFFGDILLIYSAVQLPVCLINLLTYGLIWFLAWKLLSASRTLCFKAIRVS